MKTVILVDTDNNPLGTCEIVAAHTGEGKLHRAFSVYVFRKKGKEILIQKRSTKKMLWPEIWANSCCSHPLEDESPEVAGRRRLHEEMGFICPMKSVCSFVYRAEDPSKRGVEHEYVTILLGLADDDVAVKPDPDEVAEWKWIPVEELREDMKLHPSRYAPWFHLGMNAITESIP